MTTHDEQRTQLARDIARHLDDCDDLFSHSVNYIEEMQKTAGALIALGWRLPDEVTDEYRRTAGLEYSNGWRDAMRVAREIAKEQSEGDFISANGVLGAGPDAVIVDGDWLEHKLHRLKELETLTAPTHNVFDTICQSVGVDEASQTGPLTLLVERIDLASKIYNDLFPTGPEVDAEPFYSAFHSKNSEVSRD